MGGVAVNYIGAAVDQATGEPDLADGHLVSPVGSQWMETTTTSPSRRAAWARDLAAGHLLLAYRRGRPRRMAGSAGTRTAPSHGGGQAGAGPASGHPRYRPDLAAEEGRNPCGQIRVVIASPLPTSGLARHDVAALRDRAREVICSAHHGLILAMSAKVMPSAAARGGRAATAGGRELQRGCPGRHQGGPPRGGGAGRLAGARQQDAALPAVTRRGV